MWKWMGIVFVDESNTYQAVMAVPLRRKHWAGVTFAWVVHQPFFCQFLPVFSRDDTFSFQPFYELLIKHFRYGAVLRLEQKPDAKLINSIQQLSTHILHLSPDYETIYQNYTTDRKMNLLRAQRANWHVIDSTDSGPLLNLFREYHAAGIPGGVGEWAYAILQNLTEVLQKRNVAVLRYATRAERIEAGALFVCEGNRIIYLFNAASEVGRKGNARTLLIDQLIQEYTGRYYGGKSFLLDFESPEKQSIRSFYKSFGAIETTFWEVRWNHLHPIVQALLRIVKKLTVAKRNVTAV
ncbi:GNAT family N-acetyltransferase [Spirosoma sp. BT702]|uniref:GNAT family N-acetyltransferase n=2 Tax=Spirosoma profusum TaxID=2771354 RepID=A0A926Y3G9_9BACT|nr:GNAT family N-acetyltransferase [Spirosoma profusum]